MSEEIIYFYNIKDDKYYQSRYTHKYLNNLIEENKQLKEHIEKYEHYSKTTGIEELMQENQQLKDNWNKLKNILNEQIKINNDIHREIIEEEVELINKTYEYVLFKIKELENGDDNV